MDNEIEKKFIQQFIVKNIRERLLFELSGKKRQDGIGRFCHNADDLLLKEKIILSGKELFHNEIVKTVEKYDLSKQWYIIAYNPIFDKKICKLSEALNLVLGNGMAAIIVSDNIAIIETEQCFGTPMRYICYTKFRFILVTILSYHGFFFNINVHSAFGFNLVLTNLCCWGKI